MRDAWCRMRRACASIPGVWRRRQRQLSAQCQRVPRLDRAMQPIRHARLRFTILQWRLAARGVARGTKVGSALHRLLYVLYKYACPHAGTYFGQVVLGFISRLGFYVFKVAYRIGSLHSKFLRLEFEAMQQLKLGEVDA